MAKGGFVYIMTNKYHTTLYVGMTSDLVSRAIQHRDKLYPKSFTARYNVNKLVYYSPFDMIASAIEEEKRIKGGSRKKKIELIESINPDWKDLYDDIKDW
ncbi:GIY-YIG nuclease family protein [Roseivirga sp. E12]|uniref:GIY-YIG nuclease family protein n=1 Tax=Roseivirga sp. E12 TaxID=2819237 RepID=UPI001ABD4272|nr:GIY-YIG nuclease family protein [Roseivirga sp. E12]MBO3696960.1 GIY-YIG nuclease family protein [Roseivirga sp. E12]